MLDGVNESDQNSEMTKAIEFIDDVNKYLAGMGQFDEAIFQVRLAYFTTFSGLFTTLDPTLKEAPFRWSDKFNFEFEGKGDFAMLFTKWTGTPGIGGAATFRFCSHRKPSAMLTMFTWDKRASRVNTFVHELGHMLGLDHDEDRNCPNTFMMSGKKAYPHPVPFSTCSKADFHDHYRQTLQKCFASLPNDKRHILTSHRIISLQNNKANREVGVLSPEPLPSDLFHSTPIITHPEVTSSHVPAVVDVPSSSTSTSTSTSTPPSPSTSSLMVSPPRETEEIVTPSVSHDESQDRASTGAPAHGMTQAILPAVKMAHELSSHPVVQNLVHDGLSVVAPQLLPVVRTVHSLAKPMVEQFIQSSDPTYVPTTDSTTRADTLQAESDLLVGVQKLIHENLQFISSFTKNLFGF
ncbi:hypothetical protein HMI54_015701 [Coelomomyces lativittatus]|nr:hypothetical protein HMI56_003078 [Coelomomyces lativittatus]KAJ1512464.1 hypothetical protein HMI54_015701 [Coelomomyces lativittatus]KAJ1518418.1 hypothetical protein HMI55_003550 [Coelomomyces lativittatus]